MTDTKLVEQVRKLQERPLPDADGIRDQMEQLKALRDLGFVPSPKFNGAVGDVPLRQGFVIAGRNH